eukprot:CAMPEP_0115417242 /NCGR_PEP_ID=MMETSP0271-20121206/24024_1 /TAXON_ID=71861 /ORGANISM="Scrippsiella trochoidea, Strain CCMP3099" /LENGTH=730 /DNA_ID=CAMNT_0002841625 /DNA_START=44 /DNA_END=2233 /DNA_ORIENTATION=-
MAEGAGAEPVMSEVVAKDEGVPAQPGAGDQPTNPAADSSPAVAAPDLAPVPKLNSSADWPWKAAASATAVDVTPAPDGAPAVGALAESSAEPVEVVLSFEKNMWDRFEFVWQQRVEPSQRLLEQLTEVLRSRAELERKYGESLLSMSGNISLNPQGNTVHASVEAVMVNFRNRGEQSIELGEQVDADIVSSLETVIKQHREVSQRIFKDVQVLARYCQQQRHNHDKLARRYGARCLEAELCAQECIQGLAMKTADRLKLAQKSTMLSKQARNAEHEYYASIDQANKAQKLYEQHMPAVWAALQDLEEKRGRCIKDALMKLAVYETSWLRNLQYDLEAVVKISEDADACKDLQAFIQHHMEQGEQKKRGVQLTPQAYWTCGKQKEPPKTTPMSKQQADVQKVIKRFMDEELQPPLRALLSADAAPTAVEDWSSRLQQLRLNVTDARRRAALCQVLRAELLAHENQGTDIENAKGITIPQGTLDALVPLTKSALDACDEQSDIWCGRDLMVIVNLIRAEAEDGKQISLLARVYNHALWNKVTFWEEVLLLGLCEAHAAEAVWRRSLPPGSQFTTPAMTAFLQRFLGYMMAFGISFDQARNSVWATLRKNTTLLGASCKPYANLLLQAYEAQAAAGGGGGGGGGQAVGGGGSSSARGNFGSIGSTGVAGSPGAASQQGAAQSPMPEEDFEAVALGLPAEDAGGTGTGSQDSGDEEDADGEPDDEGMKELAETQ